LFLYICGPCFQLCTAKPLLLFTIFEISRQKNRLFSAPEILQLEPISLAADIWSLGVLAYVLLTGFSPFGGDTDQETLRNITTAPLDFPAELFEGVSEDAKAFIALCLDRDPL
jgi:serine/threonine protein kinase